MQGRDGINGDWAMETPFTICTQGMSQRYYSQIFFKLALGGGASDMSRDTHCATCHESVFLKLYLAFFSNTTCFYFNFEIILNRFGYIE